jgi:hypothetical protein
MGEPVFQLAFKYLHFHLHTVSVAAVEFNERAERFAAGVLGEREHDPEKLGLPVDVLQPIPNVRQCEGVLEKDASTRLHNGIQMYYSISRVHRFSTCAANVIFDRAPVDFIAYSLYTANQGTTDIDLPFVETLVSAVRESLDHLDILAFVPKTDAWPVEMEADGIRPVDHAYCDEVDAIFKQIYREGRFEVLPAANGPHLVELWGPRELRLSQLQLAIDELTARKLGPR